MNPLPLRVIEDAPNSAASLLGSRLSDVSPACALHLSGAGGCMPGNGAGFNSGCSGNGCYLYTNHKTGDGTYERTSEDNVCHDDYIDKGKVSREACKQACDAQPGCNQFSMGGTLGCRIAKGAPAPGNASHKAHVDTKLCVGHVHIAHILGAGCTRQHARSTL